MKKLLPIIIILLGFNSLFAQTKNPVKGKSKKIVKQKAIIKKYDSNQQFLLYAGANIPLSTYANFPGHAQIGPLAGVGFDNYFKYDHWGIGMDLRYLNNKIKKSDIDQTEAFDEKLVGPKHAFITTHFNNKLSFQNIALTVGPTFRTGKNKFEFEAYAKFGVLFESFPNYLTDGFDEVPRAFTVSYTNNVKDKSTTGVAILGTRFNYKITKPLSLFLQTDYLSGLGSSKDSKFNFYEELRANSTSPYTASGIKGHFDQINKNSSTAVKTFNVGVGIKLLIGQPKVIVPEQPKFMLIGKTVTKGTEAAAANVKTTLTNVNKDKIKTEESDKNGDFSYKLEPNTDYTIVGMKDGFPSNMVKVSTKGLSKSKTFNVQLELSIKSLKVGSVMELKNIYYDLNKADIRPDAALVLDNLIRVLKENPTIKIELSSHTDSRSSDDYNLELSQRRADTAVKYLISQGIDEKRLIAKGYGESKLINKCANGIDCTEEEHQQNRRTEIKILSK